MPRYSDDDLELFIQIKDDLIEQQLEQWASKIQVSYKNRTFSSAEYRGSIFRAAIDAKLIEEISENGTAPNNINTFTLSAKRVQWYGAALEKEYRLYTEVSPKVSGQ